MSENYFQHADHFSRILSEQENYKRSRFNVKSSTNDTVVAVDVKNKISVNEDEKNVKSDKNQTESN